LLTLADGDLDLLYTNLGGASVLYINLGDGNFTQATDAASYPFLNANYENSIASAFADVDNVQSSRPNVASLLLALTALGSTRGGARTATSTCSSSLARLSRAPHRRQARCARATTLPLTSAPHAM